MIIAGQILGWIAALLTFVSYQCKEHKKLIIVQSVSTLSLCISFMFLGARSGMLLNAVGLVRNFIIYNKQKKIFSYSFWPYILAGAMAVTGALSWQGPMSLLIIVSLVLNAFFLYSSNVQNLRRVTLFTSTLALIYSAYYTAWGGAANELIAISSAAIGLYRYRKKH